MFRGLADSVRPYIADSSAAIYLDEQPLTTGAQSPEIRPIDLERIETGVAKRRDSGVDLGAARMCQ